MILMIIIPVLINMAVLTLLERKVMGFSQLRLGPNKVGAAGLLQPFSDAAKLFLKSSSQVRSSMAPMFLFSPALALCLASMVSVVVPYSMGGGLTWENSFLMIMLVFGLGVYPPLLAGWSSNSKYSLFGAMRCVAQTISYEISMAFIILAIFIPVRPFALSFYSTSHPLGAGWITPVLVIWFLVVLAELNRTPFDLGEGESELVSGFNTEYSSAKFALLFMAEYVSIIFMSMITASLLLGLNGVALLAASVALMVVVVWVRTTFPRVRYDSLMNMSWKVVLPASLGVVLFSAGVSV